MFRKLEFEGSALILNPPEALYVQNEGADCFVSALVVFLAIGSEAPVMHPPEAVLIASGRQAR